MRFKINPLVGPETIAAAETVIEETEIPPVALGASGATDMATEPVNVPAGPETELRGWKISRVGDMLQISRTETASQRTTAYFDLPGDPRLLVLCAVVTKQAEKEVDTPEDNTPEAEAEAVEVGEPEPPEQLDQ